MSNDPHPYYAGLLRWIEAQDKYTVSSLASAAGLNNATIRNALKNWHAPASATVEKIRAVIGLNYDDIIQLNDGLPPPMPSATPTRPGPARRTTLPAFSQSDAMAWTPRNDDPERQHVEDMATRLAEAKGGRDIWRVTTRAMVLDGYAVGDFLLVDPTAAPAAGDVVLAEVYDLEARGELTKLRRHEPPLLVTASPDPRDMPYVISPSARVIGVVTGSWRTK